MKTKTPARRRRVPPTPRLNVQEFDRLTGLRGWTTDVQRAASMGMTSSTISRIRSGENRPSSAFIDAALRVLGVEYSALFESTEES